MYTKDFCPKCNWSDNYFDGTYYRVVEGNQIFDLSDWDLQETEIPLPENYYPKITKIQDVVDSEDKQKPVTDEKLAAILKEKGFPIARRAVAKYREQLNIPVARLRKEL